jgi:hypothetical protein
LDDQRRRRRRAGRVGGPWLGSSFSQTRLNWDCSARSTSSSSVTSRSRGTTLRFASPQNSAAASIQARRSSQLNRGLQVRVLPPLWEKPPALAGVTVLSVGEAVGYFCPDSEGSAEFQSLGRVGWGRAARRS